MKLSTRLREVFKDEFNWTQGALARDQANGNSVDPKSPEAQCFCLEGALDKITPSCKEKKEDYYLLSCAVGQANKGKVFYNIIGFNDHYTTTFPDILKVIDAVESIENEQQQ